jgi:hypothetical protein
MLLDTMCNTFGGIILIALLIALLAREARNSQAETRAITENAALLQRQVQQAQDELGQARLLQQQLAQRAADPAASNLLSLVQRRQQLRDLNELMVEQLQAAAQPAAFRPADLVSNWSVRATAVQTNLTLERTLAAGLESQLQELHLQSNQLAQAALRQVQHLRLPREHATVKTNLNVIVRYGKIYPLYLFRFGAPERNTESVSWAEEADHVRRVEPAPDKGFAAGPAAPGLAEFLAQVRTNDFYLAFQVYEDSFPAFRAVKEAALQHGFEYAWEPRTNGFIVRLGPGQQAPQPQ